MAHLTSTSLTAFKYFNKYNLLFFSRAPNGQAYFLLSQESTCHMEPLSPSSPSSPPITPTISTNLAYLHIEGQFHDNEPSIMVAAAIEARNRTSGLLCSQNWKHFSVNNENEGPIDPENILVEPQLRSQRPVVVLSPVLNDICIQICESSLYFQDESDTVTYLVEIPFLDLSLINDFSMTRGLQHRFKYFLAEDLLDEEVEEVHHSLLLTLQTNSALSNYIRKYIVDGEAVEIKKEFAIVCCEMFAKTHLLHCLNFPAFKKHGETWRFYKAFERELPTDQDLQRMNGIIIPGSACTAYNSNVDWYDGLFTFIRNVYVNYPHLKVLGICFGAQIIAQALGGRVEKMTGDFVDEGEVLSINPDFYELDFVKNSGIDAAKQLVIAKAHYDHIVELPEGAKRYASSKNTENEVYLINDNILGIQGHPDYNEETVLRAKFKKSSPTLRNYAKFEEQMRKKTFPTPLTQKEILQVCYSFLKY